MNLEHMNARHVFPITPADALLPDQVWAIYVTGTGTLVLRTVGKPDVDTTITVPANFMLNCQVLQVRASSTATGLLGFSR